MNWKLQMFILLTLRHLGLHICVVSFISLPRRYRRTITPSFPPSPELLVKVGRGHHVVATNNDAAAVLILARRRGGSAVLMFPRHRHHRLITTSKNNKEIVGVLLQQSLLSADGSRLADHESQRGGQQDETSISNFSTRQTFKTCGTTNPDIPPFQHEEQTSSSLILAKTRESFKLSDLYFLEAKIQAESRNWTDTKLLSVDRNTGSYLLQLDCRFLITYQKEHDDNKHHSLDQILQDPAAAAAQQRLSCLDRLDWIAHGLAFGTSGHELVNNILCRLPKHDTGETTDLTRVFGSMNGFTLDYICMGCMPQKDYTTKNLLCRISQIIPVPVVLDTHPDRKDGFKNAPPPTDLILIETQHGVYLAHRLHGILGGAESNCNIDNGKNSSRSKNSLFLKEWSRRPFQYSSAMNPTVANILIDLLYDLTMQHYNLRNDGGMLAVPAAAAAEEEEEDYCRIKILDPTVGSGTFLAFAIKYGMDVTGYDIQPKCVQGTIRNLQYLFQDEEHSYFGSSFCKESTLRAAQICVGDSTFGKHHDDGETFDCAVTNLPWGQNTEMNNKNDNLVSSLIFWMVGIHVGHGSFHW